VTEAPDLATPLVGWRIWYVGADAAGPTLVSPVAPCTWPSRSAMTAACRHGCDEVPSWTCTCGLYAAKDIDLALVLAAGVLTSTSPGDSMPATAIVGKVELAGKVIEHDRGYRAERARVVEILPIEGRSRLTESLAERFGVPVGDQIPTESLEPIMFRAFRRRRRPFRMSIPTVGPARGLALRR